MMIAVNYEAQQGSIAADDIQNAMARAFKNSGDEIIQKM
jgi:hypothetical protein